MLTGYLANDGRDLSNIFMNINNGVSLTRPNTFQQKMTCLDNLDLSGCFLYGRRDGSSFDISFNLTYPIGYTKTFTFSPTITAGVDISFNPTFIMSTGVWIVNIQVTAISGINSWPSTGQGGLIQIYMTNADNSKPVNSFISHTKNNSNCQISSSYIVGTPSIILSTIIIVKNPASLVFYVGINFTSGTTTSTVSGGMTKLA